MNLNLSKPLIVFDIESTGLTIAADKIVEIALFKIHPDGKEEFRSYLINPEMKMLPEVIAIHGITNEMVADKPTFKDLANEINDFIGNSDMAGFNSNKFDVPILVEEFLRAGIRFQIKGRAFVDIQNIFHKMEPRNLRAAYKFYCDKNLENAHTAEADARATYEILLAQIKKYENAVYTDRNGNESKPIVNNISKLAEFTNLFNSADLSGHIIFNDKGKEVFNFGKHKGKEVGKVFKQDSSYYDWIMKADFPMSTKQLVTEIKLRDSNLLL